MDPILVSPKTSYELRGMRKLNMWTRLGIVLSVVWAVGAFGYTWITEQNKASNFGGFAAHVCEEGAQLNHQPTNDCWNKVFVESYHVMAKTIPADSAFMAIVPLPFFWLIAWAFFATTRWILRGRDMA